MVSEAQRQGRLSGSLRSGSHSATLWCTLSIPGATGRSTRTKRIRSFVFRFFSCCPSVFQFCLASVIHLLCSCFSTVCLCVRLLPRFPPAFLGFFVLFLFLFLFVQWFLLCFFFFRFSFFTSFSTDVLLCFSPCCFSCFSLFSFLFYPNVFALFVQFVFADPHVFHCFRQCSSCFSIAFHVCVHLFFYFVSPSVSPYACPSAFSLQTMLCNIFCGVLYVYVRSAPRSVRQ